MTSRKLKVFIGKPLDAFELCEQAEQARNASDGYQLISAQIQQAIEELRDRKKLVAQSKKKRLAGVELEPLFMSLEERFVRAQVDDSVSFYFSLGDEDEQKWTVSVDADSCAVHQGKPQHGKADCVIKTSPEIFKKMVKDSYVPSFDEFMNGTIKTNDPNLLMRFQAVFGL